MKRDPCNNPNPKLKFKGPKIKRLSCEPQGHQDPLNFKHVRYLRAINHDLCRQISFKKHQRKRLLRAKCHTYYQSPACLSVIKDQETKYFWW